MFKHASVDQLSELNAVILDIRDGQSFAGGHIPNARWVNNENAAEIISSLAKATPVVVCCYHGNSSQSAAAYLVEQGFENVYSLDGGFEMYRQAFPDAISAGQS